MADDGPPAQMRAAAGLWFPVGAGSPAKLGPPPLSDQVERNGLRSWFSALSGSRVAFLTGPAGYGKTTALRQWAADADRPVAWLTLDHGDNDQALLLGYLAAALGAAGRIDANALSGPLSETLFFDQVAMPRFAKAVRELPSPVVLALDETQVIETAAAWRLLALTAESLPTGSVTVLSGRAEPPAALFPLVAAGQVERIGEKDLAFSVLEGSTLLERLGVELPEEHVAQLVAKTEGWPAALYLAGLSLRSRSDPSAAAAEFSGDSVVVVDYLREEFLARTPPELVRFLTRTSVLDKLSGPLCDALLNAHDSDALLIRISRANLLLSPLDDSHTWFRYHQLFAEMLRAELRRLEPELQPTLHARASAWFEQNGDSSAAISHAVAADDPRRAAELLWAATPGHITTGRRATIERWLTTFEPHAVATDPLLALANAWCAVSAGEPVEPWLVTAELALGRAERPVARGISAAAAVAILRAILGTSGVEQMAGDAERAYQLEAPDSPGRSVASYLAGVAHNLLGQRDQAASWLEKGRELGRHHRTPTFWALCVAELGLLAALEQNWTRSSRLVEEATELVRAYRLGEFATMAPVFAASALVLAHDRRFAQARQAVAHARRLLGMSTYLGSWLVVETRTILARVELLLGEPVDRAALLGQAENDLAHVPDAALLDQQVDQLRVHLRAPGPNGTVGAPQLTDAEHRVVRLLSTHLSFAEMAVELEVSRNTVKTQAISAYRKLGVNSRSAAVDVARRMGLTGRPPSATS